MSLYHSLGFEEDFLKFFYYESMGANDPHGVANLNPWGMIGMVYVGKHLASQHT